jgi:hypothetical protein
MLRMQPKHNPVAESIWHTFTHGDSTGCGFAPSSPFDLFDTVNREPPQAALRRFIASARPARDTVGRSR